MRASELRTVRAFEKSKLTSNDTPPPARPTSSIKFQQLGIKYSNIRASGGRHSHSDHHRGPGSSQSWPSSPHPCFLRPCLL